MERIVKQQRDSKSEAFNNAGISNEKWTYVVGFWFKLSFGDCKDLVYIFYAKIYWILVE